MERSRAYLREQRERAIRRKKNAKCHLGCGCGICKPTKRFHRPSFSDQKKSERFLRDIDEFWKGNGSQYDDEAFVSMENDVR